MSDADVQGALDSLHSLLYTCMCSIRFTPMYRADLCWAFDDYPLEERIVLKSPIRLSWSQKVHDVSTLYKEKRASKSLESHGWNILSPKNINMWPWVGGGGDNLTFISEVTQVIKALINTSFPIYSHISLWRDLCLDKWLSGLMSVNLSVLPWRNHSCKNCWVYSVALWVSEKGDLIPQIPKQKLSEESLSLIMYHTVVGIRKQSTKPSDIT